MKHPLPPADAPLPPPNLDVTAAPADEPGGALRARGGAGADKFPVVALCGSAGSLEAFEAFFGALPARTGLAFVVVTHLGATPHSQLPQVLQNFTPLPVAEATDGLRVRPNHVYVIPPDADLSLLNGCLFLLRPTQPPGHRLPIDSFLQSLAKDVGARAVCIIFSGLGADGSVGLKAVMENFGMVLAQDPATAAFDAMPRAALTTEFVDFALAPAQMPAELLAYVARLKSPSGHRLRLPPDVADAQPAHALQKIFLLIRQRTGHDFSFYKRNTMFRRIERRMNAHQITEYTHYVRYLQHNPAELEQLFRELLIGVTKFFRDPAAFESLQGHLQALVLAKEPRGTVRVWAPGCSTGEEVYSLAMLLLECLDAVGHSRGLKLQLFATDIAPDAIDFARAGRYPAAIAADVAPARLARFFSLDNGHYQIRKEVRDVVVFALHDVNKDAPFTKLDLLCCRNLLIYLSAELQKNLLPVFHYALRPGGILFLGPSENLTGFQDLFQPLDGKWKISRRLETGAMPTRLLNFPFAMSPRPPVAAHLAPMPSTAAARPEGPFAALVQKTLLTAYTPPAVVITAKGEILYVNGRTGKYLEPAPGVGGLNLFEMARDELRVELSGAVHRALQTREDVTVERARVATATGPQLVRLSVRHLAGAEALAGLLLVVFEDQPTPRRGRQAKGAEGAPDPSRDAAAALDKELQYTKHRLQTTVEEMEGSLEELKSANEELQSANEELQSTNEEAMTNKEEMQSLNEELMTLNMQYLAKTEEFSHTASDMKNLLDATEIAIIFLDNDLMIKRFTPHVRDIISLLPSDVGRPLAHFASNLRYEHLLRDAQQVLDRLTSVEANIQTTGGKWYTMRILPYRSLDNYIDGAVITFTDVTAFKQLETQLLETARFADSLQDAVPQPSVALDGQLRVRLANHAFAEAFGLVAAEVRGQALVALSGGAWRQPALLAQLALLLDPAHPHDYFDDLVLTANFAGLGPRRVVLYGRRLLHQGQPTGQVLLGVEVVAPPN